MSEVCGWDDWDAGGDNDDSGEQQPPAAPPDYGETQGEDGGPGRARTLEEGEFSFLPSDLPAYPFTDSLFVVNGKIARLMEAGEEPKAIYIKGLGEKETERIKKLIKLRDAYYPVVEANENREIDDEEATRRRAVALKAYKQFIKESEDGKPLSDPIYRPAAWLDSRMSILIYQMEFMNPVTGKGRPSDVLTQRIDTDPRVPDRTDSLDEAMVYSLFNKGTQGTINLSYMGKLMGLDTEQVAERLRKEERAFLDPESGQWVRRDKFLTGNMRRKLEVVKKANTDGQLDAEQAALEAHQPVWMQAEAIRSVITDTWLPMEDKLEFIYEISGMRLAPGSYDYVREIGSWALNRQEYAEPRQDFADIAEWTDQTEGNNGEILDLRYKVRHGQWDPVNSLLYFWLTGKYPVVVENFNGEVYPPDDEKKAGELVWRRSPDGAARVKSQIDAFESRLRRFYQQPGRREAYEQAYNWEVNNWMTVRDYVPSAMFRPPGLHPRIDLYDYQRAAVFRNIVDGNMGLWHAVGAGKTLVMAAVMLWRKKLNLVTTPVIVLRNPQKIGMFHDIQAAFPTAQIMAPYDLNARGRPKRLSVQVMVHRIATQKPDLVLMTQNQFDELRPPSQYEMQYMHQQRAQLQHIIDTLEARGIKGEAVRTIRQRMLNVERRIRRLLQEIADNSFPGTTLHELGIDSIYVDEAHDYKNAPVESLNSVFAYASPSKRAEKMMMKALYLNAINPNKGVSLASGTPITNAATEIWVMSMYMKPRELEEANRMHLFDNFANRFMHARMGIEQNNKGEMVLKPRAAYRDPAMLQEQIIWPNSHIVTDGELVEQINEDPDPDKFVPEAEDVLVICEVDELDKRFFMRWINERIWGIGHARFPTPTLTDEDVEYTKSGGALPDIYPYEHGGLVQEGAYPSTIDNNLVAYGDLRKFWLAAQMIDPLAPEHPNSVLNKSADNIAKIYHETNDNEYMDDQEPTLKSPNKGATQLVFVDFVQNQRRKPPTPAQIREAQEADPPRVPKGDPYPFGINVYDSLVERLVAKGVKKEHIARMHGELDDEQKAELQQKARDGRVRILVGSTGVMGIGVNVQNRAIAGHHLDTPFRPDEIIQRNGRVKRQKNQNRNVKLFYYGVKGGSVALLSLQGNKSDIFEGVISNQRRSEEEMATDIVAVVADAMMGAIKGGDLSAELAKLRDEYRKASSEISQQQQQQENDQYDIRRKKDAIAEMEDRLEWQKPLKERIEAFTGSEFQTGGKDYTAKEAGLEIAKALMERVNARNEEKSNDSTAWGWTEASPFRDSEELRNLLEKVNAETDMEWVIPGEGQPGLPHFKFTLRGEPYIAEITTDGQQVKLELAHAEIPTGDLHTAIHLTMRHSPDNWAQTGYQRNVERPVTVQGLTHQLRKAFNETYGLDGLEWRVGAAEYNIKSLQSEIDAAADREYEQVTPEMLEELDQMKMRLDDLERRAAREVNAFQEVLYGLPFKDIVDRVSGNGRIYSAITHRGVRPVVQMDAGLQEELRAVVRRIAGDVKVEFFVDALFAHGQDLLALRESQRAAGISTESAEIAGYFDRAKQLIAISLGEKNIDPEETAYHEAYHAARQLLNEEEIDVLESAFLTEEHEANAFAETYKTGKFEGRIGRIFMKLIRIFRAIGDVFRKRGKPTVRSIFEEIDSGQIRRRAEWAEARDEFVGRMYQAVNGTDTPFYKQRTYGRSWEQAGFEYLGDDIRTQEADEELEKGFVEKRKALGGPEGPGVGKSPTDIREMAVKLMQGPGGVLEVLQAANGVIKGGKLTSITVALGILANDARRAAADAAQKVIDNPDSDELMIEFHDAMQLTLWAMAQLSVVTSSVGHALQSLQEPVPQSKSKILSDLKTFENLITSGQDFEIKLPVVPGAGGGSGAGDPAPPPTGKRRGQQVGPWQKKAGEHWIWVKWSDYMALAKRAKKADRMIPPKKGVDPEAMKEWLANMRTSEINEIIDAWRRDPVRFRQLLDLFLRIGKARTWQEAKRVLKGGPKDNSQTFSIIRFVFFNSMLSSPMSQVRNAIGGLVQSLVFMPLRMKMIGMEEKAAESLSSKLGRKWDRGDLMSAAHGGKAINRKTLIGTVADFRVAADTFWTMWKHGFDSDPQGQREELANENDIAAILGPDSFFARPFSEKGMGQLWPTRMLAAVDSFNRALVFRRELRAYAWRELELPGMRSRLGIETEEEAEAWIEERMGNPPIWAFHASRKKSRESTYSQQLEGISRAVYDLRNKSGFLGLMVLPFFKILANQAIMAMRIMPVTSWLRPDRRRNRKSRLRMLSNLRTPGEDRMQEINRIIGSLFLSLAVIPLVMSGMLTGSGEDDPGRRKIWRMLYRPNSFRLDGEWKDFDILAQHYSIAVGMLATVLEVLGYGTTAESKDPVEEKGEGALNQLESFINKIVRVVMSLPEQAVKKSFGYGLQPFVRAIQGREDNANWFAEWMTNTFRPGIWGVYVRERQKFIPDTHEMFDPVQRQFFPNADLPPKTDAFGRDLQQGQVTRVAFREANYRPLEGPPSIAWARGTKQERIDRHERTNGSWGWDFEIPDEKVYEKRSDEILSELWRLRMAHLKNPPRTILSSGGAGVKLDNWEYYRYRQLTGYMRRRAHELIMKKKSFWEADDHKRKRMILEAQGALPMSPMMFLATEVSAGNTRILERYKATADSMGVKLPPAGKLQAEMERYSAEGIGLR